jgi:carbon monoxide dehydrogenase subunit G
MQEGSADRVSGSVKLKVGAMTVAYRGSVEIVEADEPARTIVMRAQGREQAGQGSVSATITTGMSERDGSTLVTLVTDLSLTGRVAQFGRGLMSEISGRLLTEFAGNLEQGVLQETSPQEPPSPSANGPVDVLQVARGPLLRRLGLVGGAGIGIAVVVLLVVRRLGR